MVERGHGRGEDAQELREGKKKGERSETKSTLFYRKEVRRKPSKSRRHGPVCGPYLSRKNERNGREERHVAPLRGIETARSGRSVELFFRSEASETSSNTSLYSGLRDGERRGGKVKVNGSRNDV